MDEELMNPVVSGTLAALSNDLADAVSRAGRSLVAIHARRRIPSSGIVWSPGTVVTASHTITRGENISITLPDGSSTEAQLAGRDPATDIAVLRIDGGAPPVDRADDANLQVGRLVLAVGRPGPHATASLGIISSVGGEWRTWHGGRIDRFVRLDLSVYDGFSGGPLVEADGRVLGMNTSGLARALAMTLPALTVERVVRDLVNKGRVSRGYLGLAVQPIRLPDDEQESGRMGLVVIKLEAGAPSQRAGLLLGDIIIGLEGRHVTDPADILALLGSERVGKEVNLQVLRAGEKRTMAVVIGERPHRPDR
jgi:S1-C subfamily serine protease